MLTFQFDETTTGPTIDPVCLAQNENSLAKTSRNRSALGCSSFWTETVQSYANGITLYAAFWARF